MAATLEREIKLRFDSAAEARAAVLAAGAAPARVRRLQEDCLLDTADNQLRQRRCVLRVRMESGKGLLTFKGPVQPSIERSEEHTSELQSLTNLVCRLLLEKKKYNRNGWNHIRIGGR